MTGLIIAGVVLALLIVLCMTRLGVRAIYSDNGLQVWAKAAFYRIKVFPAETDKTRQTADKAIKKAKKKAAETTEEKGGPLELFRKYFDLALDALKYLRRAIRIDLLSVRFVAAAKDDAAKAAVLYGRAWAAEGIILGILENNMKVKKKEIAIRVDYTADAPTIFCRADASVSVGGLLLAALRIAADYFKRRMHTMKRKGKGGTNSGKANC